MRTSVLAELPSVLDCQRRSTPRERATLWLCGNWTGSVVRCRTSWGWSAICKSGGVGLKVLTGDVDTTTVTGRLVFGIFATLAEFERDLIHERTMAGLVAARARGRSGGRPRVMTKAKLKTAMTMMGDRENAARDVAVQLGISLSTLYAYVDAQGQPRARSAELLGKRPRIPVSILKPA